MARYVSLPAECEAEQWFPEISVRGVVLEEPLSTPLHHYVTTTHGQKTYVQPGDYIVREPDGRGYYPVKPDIFVRRWKLKEPQQEQP